jgi:hypothetical protein
MNRDCVATLAKTGAFFVVHCGGLRIVRPEAFSCGSESKRFERKISTKVRPAVGTRPFPDVGNILAVKQLIQ